MTDFENLLFQLNLIVTNKKYTFMSKINLYNVSSVGIVEPKCIILTFEPKEILGS